MSIIIEFKNTVSKEILKDVKSFRYEGKVLIVTFRNGISTLYDLNFAESFQIMVDIQEGE